MMMVPWVVQMFMETSSASKGVTTSKAPSAASNRINSPRGCQLRQRPPATRVCSGLPHPVNSKREVSNHASSLHFANQSEPATFNILIVDGSPHITCMQSHLGPT